MPGPLRLAPLLLALLASTALAQVEDDFADGDFTDDPPWTGETDRFTVVPFGADFALRSDGVAASDTIHLATGSDVAFGRWAFTFRYEANLTNANGTRVYLVADTPELEGEVFGYYVQIGTNNSDEVRLYRQDGPATSRVVVGASEGPIATDEEGTLAVEVLRDDAGRWQLSVDGATVIAGVQDATYTGSAALGVWAKHSTQNGAAFFWDDFVADPDADVDLGGPVPQSVTVLDDGGTLLVQFDEVLAASTVTPENFALDNDVGPPSAATLAGDGTVAELTFVPPIPEGDYVLSIENVEDLDGNPVAEGSTISFSFETDDEPPELVSAEAVSATRVDVTFSEPVQGCDAALYTIAPEIGQPSGIECPPGDDGESYGLLLGTPLSGPQTYTVTATDVADLAGNVQPETAADFFFGSFDAPAPGEIVVNEVMLDPPDVAANEYVELYNRTAGQTFDLSALTFADDNDEPVPIVEAPTPLGPGDFAVLVRDADAFEAAFPDVPFVLVEGFPALNNTGDTPTIRFEDTVIDAVPYAQSWGGTDAALERRSPDGPSAVPSNWATSLDPRGGTPGEENSVPPDEEPPAPTDADLSPDGRTLTVSFDEPLDPATVTPGAFTIEGGPAVTEAAYLGDDDPAVALTLAEAPAPGLYTLTITGVADQLGNATDGAEIAFAYDPDVTPPSLVGAVALDATTVEAIFSEPLDAASASDPSNYEISDGIGPPTSAALGGDGRRVTLTLATPLSEQQPYTLTARDVRDLAGNEMGEGTATFYFGEGDAPAPGELVVNEVMFDPPDVAANEYVELYNRTESRTFDLRDLTLADEANTVPITADPVFLQPGAYAVLVRDADAFQQRFPDVPFVAVAGFPALNNGGDAVVIRYTPDAVRVDSVRYAPSWGGTDAALERRSPDGPSNSAGNWATSLDPRGGTPGEPNSVPPDEAPPTLVDLDVASDGRTLTVFFDEPLDPETVTPGAFGISGDAPAVAEAAYLGDDAPAVTLTLAAPLSAGDYTLTADGIADQLGNATTEATIDFSFAPDETPPSLVGAIALDATTVEAVFSEPVEPASAADPANYEISGGIGSPASAEPGGDARRVTLTLATPLSEQQPYTLTARDVRDLAGNEMGEGTATFYFGEGDAPAPGELVVNEIMFDPPSVNSNEYVELRNTSDKTFDLSDFTFSDLTNTTRIAMAPRFVLPDEYVVLVRDPEAFEAAFPGVPFVAVSGFPSLNNGGDAVVIAYDRNPNRQSRRAAAFEVGRNQRTVVDSVRYAPSWGGTDASLERRSPDGPSNSAGNWATSLDPRGGTPGEPNSVPPDTTPPAPDDVDVANDGRTLAVLFTELLDPETVTPGAFSIDETITPSEASYSEEGGPVVTLTLSGPLALGEHTLAVTGLADLQGNVADGETLSFDFDPDTDPPALLGASAPDSARVEIVFSEEVGEEAGDPSRYAISEGVEIAEVTLDGARALLGLGTPLEEGVVYTLTVTGIPDAFGNVLGEASTRFLLGGGTAPVPGEVVVTEIMYDLPSDRNDEEYVELYNAADVPFDLSTLTLSDTGTPGALVGAPTLLLPGEYVAVVADAAAFRQRFPEAENFVQAGRFPSLNNTGDAVVIRSEDAVIDSLFYSSDWQRPELDTATGIALERIAPEGPSADAANWTSSLDPAGGTPGARNSVHLPPGEAPAEPGLVADPSPFNASIGTQIRYTLASDAALVRLRIFDGAGRLVRTLEDAALGGNARTGTLTWQGRDDDNQPLRIGIYILFLEALDVQGGRTEAYKKAVVLGRDL